MPLTNPRFPANLDQTPPDQDRRNVIDHFKYWSDEAIRAALDQNRRPFSLLLENFAYDFNISSAIRNANAFLAQEIWISGRRKWDKRGAVGVHHYEHVHHARESATVIDDFRNRGYQIVVFDNIDGASDLRDYSWQPETLMIFGQEDIGVSQTALDRADDVVYIPQFGSTRSLNVGCSSGIAMYDYAAKVSFAAPCESTSNR
jgi:tRNA G18 (ribose-2'-O)-methylase SpoU